MEFSLRKIKCLKNIRSMTLDYLRSNIKGLNVPLSNSINILRLTYYQRSTHIKVLRPMAHKPDTVQFRRAIYNSQSGTISTLPRWGDQLRFLFENGRNRSSARSITAARNTTEIPLIALRVERRVARVGIILSDRHATTIIPDSV